MYVVQYIIHTYASGVGSCTWGVLGMSWGVLERVGSLIDINLGVSFA